MATPGGNVIVDKKVELKAPVSKNRKTIWNSRQVIDLRKESLHPKDTKVERGKANDTSFGKSQKCAGCKALANSCGERTSRKQSRNTLCRKEEATGHPKGNPQFASL
jgi:hypothetical protein